MMCLYLFKFSFRRKLLTILVCIGITGFCSQIIAGTTADVSVTEGNSVTVTYNLGYTAPVGGVDVEVVTNPTTASALDYSIAANQLGWRTISSGSDSIDVSISATSDSMVEGNEILMVGFFENLATDPGFDLSEGSNQWAGEDTTLEGNVRYLGPAGSALNNVLHLANKLNPSRIFTINPGDDYLFTFELSPATADGSGGACNEPGSYSGYDNAADALELRVIDRNDPSNDETTIVIDYGGSGAPATFFFDDTTVSLSGTTTAGWSSSIVVEFTVYDFSGSEYMSNCGFVIDDFRLIPAIPEISNVTINDSDISAPTTSSSTRSDDGFVDQVMTYLKQTIASEAQKQGERLIVASHKLIRTSVEHLIVRARLAQNMPTLQKDGASTTTASSGRGTDTTGFTQSVMATPIHQQVIASDTVILSAFTSPDIQGELSPSAGFAQIDDKPAIIDGVQLLSVDADDEQYKGKLHFDLYRPLIASGDALITKIIAEMSDQDGGPETTRLIASVGLEEKLDDSEVMGRFIHVTQEKSDYNSAYTGSRDTYGASVGMYRIYSPRVNQLFSIYGSTGLATTDLVLKRDGVTSTADYLSYNLQTGFSVSRTVKTRRLLAIYEFSGDLLYNYQTEHTARFSNGIASFDRLMAGKTYHEYTASLSPKYVFSLSRDNKQTSHLLSIVPRLKCGSGSLNASCGGGLGVNMTKPFAKADGFSTVGINYERYRKTDTISYFLDLNKQLGHENITLDTQLNHDRATAISTSSPADYGIRSTLNIQF